MKIFIAKFIFWACFCLIHGRLPNVRWYRNNLTWSFLMFKRRKMRRIIWRIIQPNLVKIIKYSIKYKFISFYHVNFITFLVKGCETMSQASLFHINFPTPYAYFMSLWYILVILMIFYYFSLLLDWMLLSVINDL